MKKKVGMPPRTEPTYKLQVLDIYKRREAGETFREIAELHGMTRMNAYYQYTRWKDWASQQSLP